MEKIYYFSVEGQTEKEYLKWLEKLINRELDSALKIRFDVKVTPTPLKRLKSLPKDQSVDVYHLCDYESNDSYHQKLFEKTIDSLNRAKDYSYIKNYYLAYSNYTFDLWLILHKADYFGAVSHRKNYIREINHIFKTDFRGMQEFKRKENLRKLFKQFSLKDVKNAIMREKEIYQQNKRNHYNEINYKGYRYFRENPSLTVGFYIRKILLEIGLYDE